MFLEETSLHLCLGAGFKVKDIFFVKIWVFHSSTIVDGGPTRAKGDGLAVEI